MHNPALADALFHLRGRRTQEVFAREVGVSKLTILRWERGETAGMRLEHAQRLKELGMAPELLLDVPSTRSILVSVSTADRGNASGIVAESNETANPVTRGVA